MNENEDFKRFVISITRDEYDEIKKVAILNGKPISVFCSSIIQKYYRTTTDELDKLLEKNNYLNAEVKRLKEINKSLQGEVGDETRLKARYWDIFFDHLPVVSKMVFISKKSVLAFVTKLYNERLLS